VSHRISRATAGHLRSLLLGALWVALTQPASAIRAPIDAARRPHHIFLIVLENQSFSRTFGAHSPAPYLSQSLTKQGALLTQYYSIGHNSLGNYVALISGQAPNVATQSDCVRYSEFRLTQAALGPFGQALGVGCIYPSIVRTLPDQLETARLSWRGYMEDMGKDPQREPRTCAHAELGARDRLLEATPRDQYASKHNPFIYFHAIIDEPARCATHVVNLDELPRDLVTATATPNFVFITPNLCHDGHDAPCADGEPGGLVSADAFLRHWVPLITSSPAFVQDGLLVITFDESDAAGADAATACCGEQPLPGARYPPGIIGPGGGRIGAVLLSRFITPGTVSEVAYNHYSLLRSIESFFGLEPLGYAADSTLNVFGTDVFR